MHILSQHCLSGVEEKRACDEKESENVYTCICVFAPFLVGEQLLRFRPGRHLQDLAGLHPEPCLHALTTVQRA